MINIYIHAGETKISGKLMALKYRDGKNTIKK